MPIKLPYNKRIALIVMYVFYALWGAFCLKYPDAVKHISSNMDGYFPINYASWWCIALSGIGAAVSCVIGLRKIEVYVLSFMCLQAVSMFLIGVILQIASPSDMPSFGLIRTFLHGFLSVVFYILTMEASKRYLVHKVMENDDEYNS